MAKRKKKKYPQKRNKHITPYASGAIFIIDTIEMPTLREKAAFHMLGVSYYKIGQEDKAGGKEALGYETFAELYKLFENGEDKSPDGFPGVIAQAQWAQYMDGYMGADYHDIVFRKVYI
jgi:hypothetical protein